MYKINTSILDWVMILAKVSYTMVAFVLIKIFVTMKNVMAVSQKLIFLKSLDFDKTPRPVQYQARKTGVEKHFLQELYATKSISNSRTREH